ncbi:hypothetical protein LJC71_11160 [Desulfosarcina sp. OttesenSCG-928-A07]|nr:hypothetical protein [Desulfosarcina sp. OttesenSCG-928-A07]
MDWYTSGEWLGPQPGATLDNRLFAICRNYEPEQPNYIHDQKQITAFPELQKNNYFMLSPLLKRAFFSLAENCLEIRHNRIYVRHETFSEWQNLITCITPLPFLAACALSHHKDLKKAIQLLVESLKYSTLPSCYDPLLDMLCNYSHGIGNTLKNMNRMRQNSHASFFGFTPRTESVFMEKIGGECKGQLHDLHFHWNGTTEADFVWAHCMGDPNGVIRELLEKWNKNDYIKRYYHQHGISSPYFFHNGFQLAQWLHRWMTWTILQKKLSLPSEIANWDKCKYDRKKHCDCVDRFDCENHCGSKIHCKCESDVACANRHGRKGIAGCDSDYRNGKSLSKIDIFNQIRFQYNFPQQQPPLHSFMKGRLHSLKPFSTYINLPPDATSIQLEGVLWLYILYELDADSQLLPYLVHPYLLLQCRFHQMLVQQVSQVGFDQFQNLSDIGLRDHQESHSYYQRFLQLEGMYGPYLGYTEGRFAPKISAEKNRKLIGKLLDGYCRAHGWLLRPDTELVPHPRQKPDACVSGQDIGLVAHFIKRKENDSNTICRYSKLRKDTLKQAIELVKTMRQLPVLRNILVGKDAAANEMHAPPEIFAPLFRYLGDHGITHSTYHAGEDYLHLASGIRAVEEAIRFLDLRSGDRIGHCTALGIAPDIWRRSMDPDIYLPQGEWLDNLIWISMRIRREAGFSHFKNFLMNKIERFFFEIYGELAPPLYVLHRAWKNRQLDARFLYYPFVTDFIELVKKKDIQGENLATHQIENFKSSLSYLSNYYRTETSLIIDSISKDFEAFRIFKKYHTKKIREKYEKPIKIKRDDISDEVFIFLQDTIVSKMCEKNILAEVMPTSNVRISFYKKYSDHHMMLWVDPDNKRPKPVMTLATDDPGIFSTNLRNEYSHFIHAIRTHLKFSADQAYRVAAELMQNAKAYKFQRHHPDTSKEEKVFTIRNESSYFG